MSKQPHWTKEQCKRIIREHREGKMVREIAREMDLNHNDVGAYLRSLGINTHWVGNRVVDPTQEEIRERSGVLRRKHFAERGLEEEES